MIESYSFGEMVVDGKRYHSDLILYPDRIDENWWRKEGHKLCIADIENIVFAQPECLIVGTGNSGSMRVLSETEEDLKKKGIQLIAEPTAQAYKTYNEMSTKKRAIGAFHLAC